MATRGIQLPSKLTHDAIVEALLEVRFDTTTIPEILIGRLASYAPWKGFKQNRLSAYNVPPPLRDVDTNLRFQPIVELVRSDRKYSIRIGPHVLSLHVLAPYIGWERFRAELQIAVDQLFSNAEDIVVRRVGLRYTNALKPDSHSVRTVADLDMVIKIAQQPVLGKVNLNFTTDLAENSQCMVRVATPDFVTGAVPDSTSLIVDVDVYTKDGFKTKAKEEVLSWIDFAHEKEKEEFFHLLPEKLIESLREA